MRRFFAAGAVALDLPVGVSAASIDMSKSAVAADPAFEKTGGAHGTSHRRDFPRRTVEDDVYGVVLQVIRIALRAGASRIISGAAVDGDDFLHGQVQALGELIDNLQSGPDISPKIMWREGIVNAPMGLGVRSDDLANRHLVEIDAVKELSIVREVEAKLGDPSGRDIKLGEDVARWGLKAGEKVHEGVGGFTSRREAGACQGK
ncbi:MAG TPA: hypothetical protein VIT23_13380 [Terrimicrobiaceae bacterium]